MNNWSKDEILYFLKRFRLPIVIGAILLIVIIIVIVSLTGGNKNNLEQLIEPPNDSAIALDGTTYEAEYVQTNFELKQLVVEGDWKTGRQYRVYFDRVKNDYACWEVVKTLTGSSLQQIDYNFVIIGSPGELTEIPTGSLAGINTLKKLDDGFYLYEDISQIYSYINANLNKGYSLKYLKAQSNMCEAYYTYFGRAYHLLASDGIMAEAQYKGTMSAGMLESDEKQPTSGNAGTTGTGNDDQLQIEPDNSEIEMKPLPEGQENNPEDWYAPGLAEGTEENIPSIDAGMGPGISVEEALKEINGTSGTSDASGMSGTSENNTEEQQEQQEQQKEQQKEQKNNFQIQ